MSKYKVGDRVRIKPYDAVENHFGIGRDSWENDLKGIVEIERLSQEGNYHISGWFVKPEHIAGLAHDNHKIVITTDGPVTLARLYEDDKVVKRAKAKCSPKDTYDFATGANLAYQRLMDVVVAQPCDLEEPKEDKPAPEEPKFYSGKVVCVDADGDFTRGKVYEFLNGKVKDNDGSERPCPLNPYERVKALDDWNRVFNHVAKFIEFKGE